MSAAAMRLRRQRLSAAGLCIDCAERPNKPSARRCVECAEKVNQYRRSYPQRKRQYWTGRGTGDVSGATLAIPFSDVTAVTGLTPQQISCAIGGASFLEIGLALGISTQRAQQICYRAMNKIYVTCKNMGIDPSMIIGKGFSMLATAERWA